MSLTIGSQNNNQELFKASKFSGVPRSLKKTVVVFFERPLFYIYYTALLGMVMMSLFGQRFHIEFYLFMLALTIYHFYAWAKKKKKNPLTRLYVRRKPQRGTLNAQK